MNTVQILNLDHNATTPTDPRVLELVARTERDVAGNPSSLHRMGRAARRTVEEAREQVAAVLKVDPREICWVSSATEANNLALRGLLQDPAAKKVAVSPMEHKSVLEPLQELASRGAELLTLPVTPEGCVDLEASEPQWAARTDFLVVQSANNETGCLQPLGELARVSGADLIVDAAQMPGRHTLSGLSDLATAITLSGHKMGGPRGVGVLFLRRESRLRPQITGGAQERERRAGTENVAAIAGFGLALHLAEAEHAERVQALKKLERTLCETLEAHFPEGRINGEDGPRLPGVINYCFSGLSAETLMMSLDMEGVLVSLGSACSSGSAEASHVLEAMGLSREDNFASLRLSLSHTMTAQELARFSEILKSALARQKKA